MQAGPELNLARQRNLFLVAQLEAAVLPPPSSSSLLPSLELSDTKGYEP